MPKQSSLLRVARAAAEHLGVGRTDLRILAAVRRSGPVPAGALSGAVELSPTGRRLQLDAAERLRRAGRPWDERGNGGRGR